MESNIIGKVIDNYHILAVLGKGGMGIVYKAKDMALDREVALKMMDASLLRDESFLKRFQSEAKALAKLQNPNIVSVFALRETEMGLCIVMEFVDGYTLADRIRESGALQLEMTLKIFKQLLTALDHAHNAGIIHRDIKPSNVMLTKSDVVKVTDFGLAKIQQVSAATATVGTGGTLFYMSPEQVRGLANVDARGDIYSLGMTLYEAVAGQIPFSTSDTDFSIRQAIVEGRIPPPDKLNRSVSKDLVKVIMKAIEKDPDKRFQTASEMWTALEKFERNGRKTEKKPADETTEPPVPTPSPIVRRLVYGVAALVILIMVGLALMPLFSPQAALLTITSEPGKALVSLNDEYIGETPISNHETKQEKLAVRIAKASYQTRDTSFTIEGGQRVSLLFVLKPTESEALLKIDTQPRGARVRLNGKDIGSTPVPSFKVAPGNVAVRLEKDFYLPMDTSFVIEVGQNVNLDIPLVKIEPTMAALILRSEQGVSIFVDGERKASEANNSGEIQVAGGTHKITFRHPKFGESSESIRLKAGDRKRYTCFFQRPVPINADPGWGIIVVDGRKTELQTPNVVSVGRGKHSFTVSKIGYETEERVLEVEPIIVEGSENPVNPAYLLSFKLKKK